MEFMDRCGRRVFRTGGERQLAADGVREGMDLAARKAVRILAALRASDQFDYPGAAEDDAETLQFILRNDVIAIEVVSLEVTPDRCVGIPCDRRLARIPIRGAGFSESLPLKFIIAGRRVDSRI
ncbi:hypothetical protein E7V67_010435 [[Empedobacter] haloabium]|uniref:Uncharacterized protein n=1 Tax=[Empedobacter] haloabium TaxID=592317 RepID=A0ABZ1URZ6_9BURK